MAMRFRMTGPGRTGEGNFEERKIRSEEERIKTNRMDKNGRDLPVSCIQRPGATS